MGKPKSIYSYNLGKSNGIGSSSNAYNFVNRENGGLGSIAFFPSPPTRSIITPPPIIPIISQLTEYIGEYNGKYYIALLLLNPQYLNGIDDVLYFFKTKFPNTKIRFVKYVIDTDLSNIEDCLSNFINLYPDSNRVIISELTEILNKSNSFLENQNLKILNISLSSNVLTTQKLTNTLTYSYYLNNSVSTSFYIIADYGITNIVILIESASINVGFLNSYKDTIILQNNLLKKINLIQYNLNEQISDSFFIPNNSIVYLLSDTNTIKNNIEKIKSSFINNLSSFIFMTDINYDMEDIFENIPAVVSLPVPSSYTLNSDLVYNSVTKKNSIYYGVYAFYDILYTLNNCSDNKIFITKKTYLESNPFNNTPPAWHTEYSIKEKYNGFSYAKYDIIFTKDSIIDKDRLLYNSCNNNGSIANLPNSRSIFKTTGIFPNLPTIMAYLDRNYIKLYQEDGTLKYVKFDTNNSNTTDGTLINSSDKSKSNFFILFNRTKFLITKIDKIFNDNKFIFPEINITMSKTYFNKYFKKRPDINYNLVIGNVINYNLNGIRVIVRSNETNLGNVVSDSLLYAGLITFTDIPKENIFAFINSGSVRNNTILYKNTDLKVQDIYTIIPFAEIYQGIEIVGRTAVNKFLNYIGTLSLSLRGTGAWLQISKNMEFNYTTKKYILKGGSENETDKFYCIVTTYIANGGDGYKELPKYKIIDTKIKSHQNLINYIKSIGGSVSYSDTKTRLLF